MSTDETPDATAPDAPNAPEEEEVDHWYSKDLQRSIYLSSHAHMGEVYVYHGLYGYLLKMSPDILEFIDAFVGGADKDEVCRQYANRFGEATPESFISTLIDFSCLMTVGYDERLDIWPKVAVKGRWNVWHKQPDGGLILYSQWGDQPLTKTPLTPEETAIWNGMDGETLLEELAREHGREPVRDLVVKLANLTVQALKLSPVKLSYYKGRAHMKPPYLESTMPYAVYDVKTSPPLKPMEDYFSPEGYYRHEVDDADEQFDVHETTLSHLFRRPHPALKNRSYGQTLTEILMEKGWADKDDIRVLEVGAGLGYFAKAVVESLQGAGKTVHYDIIELAPALAAAQRERCAGLPVTVHEGDCLTIAFPRNDYDLVFANEMIGDLTALKSDRESLGITETGIDDDKWEACLDGWGLAGDLVRRHKIPIADAPDPFYLNVGAWQLIDRLGDVVAPSGKAILTEFGNMAQWPILSTQLDHPELSIHFGHCMIVAKSVGFEPMFVFLMDLIDMNREMKGMATTRSQLKALQALLAEHGIELEKIGYTKQMFKNLLGDKLRLRDIGEIRFERIEDRLMGLVPHEFKALMLAKLPADA